MIYNPWHGCHKISPGCLNCYVYRMDERYQKDSSIVKKTQQFDLPIRKHKDGSYVMANTEIIYTCFTSDFFVEEADEWRKEVYAFIKERQDCHFLIITKRIDRFYVSLPDDWEDGYPNVSICCTVENQVMADYRLPLFLKAPIKHKQIICEPLIDSIDLSSYLNPSIEALIVGGESGPNSRVCDYDWVMHIRETCIQKGIPFHFKQTGRWLRKDNTDYFIARKYQMIQAKKANIDWL